MFEIASPVWAKNREREMNCFLGFRHKYTAASYAAVLLLEAQQMHQQ